MTITRPSLVVPFYYRGDDSRPMRVVVTGDNDATVEEPQGSDALGVERWSRVEMEGVDEHGSLEAYPHEWAEMVACALAHYLRERLPSGDAPPQEPSECTCDPAPGFKVRRDASLGWMYETPDGGSGRKNRGHHRCDAVAETWEWTGHTSAMKGGDAPQEPSLLPVGTETAATALLDHAAELLGVDSGMIDGDVWDMHVDSFAVKMLEASRPPGGAEPGLREAVEALAATIAKSLDVGPAVSMRFVAARLDAILASEGAAPPPQPGNVIDTMDISVKVAGVEHARPVSGATVEVTREPSGVPDAPNATGWWWRLYGAEFEYETPTHVWFNVKPHGCHMYEGLDGPEPVTDGSRWGGKVERCTPDADAGTLEALHGAESDLRRIAEMFGDEQGNAVELAAGHAGLRAQLLDITPHVESLRDALSERRGHALMHDSAKFICKLLRAALEVKS